MLDICDLSYYCIISLKEVKLNEIRSLKDTNRPVSEIPGINPFVKDCDLSLSTLNVRVIWYT